MQRYVVFLATVAVLCSLLFSAVVFAEEGELPVANGSFEVLPAGVKLADALGKLPLNWSVTAPATATQWEIGLSDKHAYEGNLSLHIQTKDREGGILISSQPISVVGGKTYAAMGYFYNIDEDPLYKRGPHLYVEFWSDNNWWGTTDYWSEAAWAEQKLGAWTSRNRLAHKLIGSYKLGEFEERVVIVEAPAEAKYATISLWTFNATMHSYADGFRFAEVQE